MSCTDFEGQRTRRADGVSFSPSLSIENPWLCSKTGKEKKILSYPVLFYLAFNRLGKAHPTLWRAICFTQFADSKVTVIQKFLHRYIQNNVLLNVWAPHGPVNMTHKINHRKFTPCHYGTHTHLLKSYISKKTIRSKFI